MATYIRRGGILEKSRIERSVLSQVFLSHVAVLPESYARI